ncbi:MAG: AarF/ABC1/UbiB kinase family protein [Phycisphaerales bacterium]|nr:AarF/ABC1/UbiB kinase family protein [Phycisphaerales bacterium]
MPSVPLATSVKSLNRLQQIARVLARHGFGHIVERMNLGRYLPMSKMLRADREAAQVSAQTSVGRRLSAACAELGPTFVKLGQMFSTRPDLLPDDILGELRGLQDHVPAFDHESAMAIVCEETGAPIEENFSEFGDAPFACGSIGQVYHARTKDNHAVVVKVKRPGIDAAVRQDLVILKWLASTAEQWLPELARFKPPQIIEEFEQLLTHELDFISEASATARFEEAFADDDNVHIPHVYWELTGPRVLTVGAVSGRNIDALVGDNGRSIDRHLLARRLVNVYLTQFFDMRFFHADPHPGNLLISPPARIGLIDFGQVGTLSDETASQLVIMIVAMVYREPQVVVDVLSDLGAVEPDADTRALARALRQLLDKYHGLPLKRLDLVGIFGEIAAVMRAYNVTLPREMVMVLKTITTIAGVALKLDPGLDLVAILSPRLRGLIAGRLSPKNLARTTGVAAWHVLSILKTAPGQLRTALRQLSKGKWQVHIRHENIEHLAKEMDRSSNRVAFALVIAAIIVGSSVVISATTTVAFLGIPIQWIGIAGYIFAGVMGIRLLWAIFRSGRLS